MPNPKVLVDDDPWASVATPQEDDDPWAAVVAKGKSSKPSASAKIEEPRATVARETTPAPGARAAEQEPPPIAPAPNPILQPIEAQAPGISAPVPLAYGPPAGWIDKARELASGLREGIEALSEVAGGGRLISPIRVLQMDKAKQEATAKKFNRGTTAAFETVGPMLGGAVAGQVAKRGIPYLANLATDVGGGLLLEQGAKEVAKRTGLGPEASQAVGTVAGALPFTAGAGDLVEGRVRRSLDAPLEARAQAKAAAEAGIPHAPGADWKAVDDALVQMAEAERQWQAQGLPAEPDKLTQRLRQWGSSVPPESQGTVQFQTPIRTRVERRERLLGPASPGAKPQMGEPLVRQLADEDPWAAQVPLAPEKFYPDSWTSMLEEAEGLDRWPNQTPRERIRQLQQETPGTLTPSPGVQVLDKAAAEKLLFGRPEKPSVLEGPWAPRQGPLDKFDIGAPEGQPGLVQLLKDPQLLDRDAVLKQAENLFYELGLSREEALAKGLPKESFYLGKPDFQGRGAPSAQAWRELIDHRSSMLKPEGEESLAEPLAAKPETQLPEVGSPAGQVPPLPQAVGGNLPGEAPVAGVPELPQANLGQALEDSPLDLRLPAEGQGGEVKYQSVPADVPAPIQALPQNSAEVLAQQQLRAKALEDSLPGLKVLPEERRRPGAKQAFWLKTPGGTKVEIRLTDAIEHPDPSRRATGSYQTRSVHAEPLIRLTEEGLTTNAPQHEAFHFAWENLLTPKERRALLKQFGTEEGAASAFRLKGPAEQEAFKALRNRLQAMREWLAPSAPGVMARLERTNQASIWARRRMGLIEDPESSVRAVGEVKGHAVPGISWPLLTQRLRSTFTSGLQASLEQNPTVYTRAVAPTVTEEKWRSILRQAGPKLAEAVKPSGYSDWQVVRDVLVESRFLGVKERWNAFLNKTLRPMTEDQLKESLKPKGEAAEFLKQLDKTTKGAYLAKARSFSSPKEAKDYLDGLFQGFVDSIPTLDLQGKYGKEIHELAEDPGIAKAIRLYKEMVETPAREMHLANEGILSSELGPLDTWYPLIPEERYSDRFGWLASARRRSDWVVPDNPLNNMALANAKSYDRTIEGLVKRLAFAEKRNRTAELMRFLSDSGFAREGKGSVPEEISVRGETQPVKVYALRSGEGDLEIAPIGGKTAERWMAIPTRLADQIEHIILTPQYKQPSHNAERFDQLVDAANGWALLGPFDNRYNIQNIMGAIFEGLPWSGSTMLGKVPVLKQLLGLGELAKASRFLLTPEGQKWYTEELVPLGAANPRVGLVTKDKAWAEQSGMEYRPTLTQLDYYKPEKLTPDERRLLEAEGKSPAWATLKKNLEAKAEGIYGPLAYGPAGIDAATRRVLWEWHTKHLPEATPAELAQFVNQVGLYNKQMQGAFERSLKGSRSGRFFAPFYTMGATMIRNGLRMVSGQVPGLPRTDPMRNAMIRLGQSVSGGLLAYTASWYMLNKELGGEAPKLGDGKSRMGYIRVSRESLDKHPWMKATVETLHGKLDPGEEVYIPMSGMMTWTHKGLQTLGIARAADSAFLGAEDGTQLFWDGVAGGLSAGLHPFVGGALPQAALGAMGVQPWVSSFYDRQGAFSFQSFVERREPSRGPAESVVLGATRALAPMSQVLDPFARGLVEQGLGRSLEARRNLPEFSGRALAGVWEMVVPRTAPAATAMDRRRRETLQVQKGRRSRQVREAKKVEVYQ